MALIPIALGLGSCDRLDLVAVREFTAISQAATEQFPELAADSYGSCVRAAKFDSETLPTPAAVQDRCDRFKRLAPG
ncbi:MAG TPA: hypothetical protein V6D03_03420, partial [Candidatus Caenarcaniphilales bacterium]